MVYITLGQRTQPLVFELVLIATEQDAIAESQIGALLKQIGHELQWYLAQLVPNIDEQFQAARLRVSTKIEELEILEAHKEKHDNARKELLESIKKVQMAMENYNDAEEAVIRIEERGSPWQKEGGRKRKRSEHETLDKELEKLKMLQTKSTT